MLIHAIVYEVILRNSFLDHSVQPWISNYTLVSVIC